MGFINHFTRKCVFCKSKENVEYIEAYGIYGEICWGDWYHKGCLREVVCSPEKFPSIIVDRAIDIIDRIKEKNIKEEWKISKAKEKCVYLNNVCDNIMDKL